MIKFTAFKTRKPRQFEYRPRYYDTEKESREQRRKEILGDKSTCSEKEYNPGEYIRLNMRARRGIGECKAKKTSMTLSMGIMALIILALAVWWALS